MTVSATAQRLVTLVTVEKPGSRTLTYTSTTSRISWRVWLMPAEAKAFSKCAEDEPTDEEIREAVEQIAAEEKAEQPKPTVSPVYQKYLDVQDKYPQAIVAMRLGDFYEVFGDNAELLADELDLTLTGRDCGLESRVPMVGFPYHASDAYLKKILGNGHAVALIENDGIRELPSAQNIDLETGEILSEEEMREFDGDIEEPDFADDEPDLDLTAFDTEALAALDELLGNEITLR